MKTTVISGFHPRGYTEYGKGFLRTFDRYWPKEVDLVVYTEEPVDTGHGERNIGCRALWSIPGIKDFVDEHSQNLIHTGKEPIAEWSRRDHKAGYAYRHDAVRFCRQLFIPEHASLTLEDGDIMAWLDADVMSFSEVPGGLIQNLLGDADLVHLGRAGGADTELGFWAVRLNDKSRRFLERLANCCRDNSIFNLRWWHSGFVFDHWLSHARINGLKIKSLTEGHGHVWFDCELGRYTDHLKGDVRKQLGYSPEREGRSIREMRSK